ncbi:adenosylmethionine decarboxylase [Aliikangiella coralliicola]|uniref:S-adenosylmethionine decarboxylase proenzyme n=1 Tax=Aliikangiella coralliicola TaxID=2592383 RepID=A0A545UBJ5_9GAMM|nr:adenosylmethionine decarboxylase [Aliikangiella coralliicola]TQV86835.1 adenosylmethionine decarboxylase [Aliikangiella coralliicola]
MLKNFDYNSEIDPTVATETQWPEFKDANENDERKDHFVRRDGKTFAGTHIIIDLWEASKLDDLQVMEKAFREAVDVCNATLLHIHLHHFSPNGGISGVAVLAESHISVHTWPEADYAAFDVFMCGDAEPHKATEILRKAFTPSRIDVREILRGENIEQL